MESKYKILFIIAVLFVTSCYKDKGNYVYNEQPTPLITKIEKEYKIFIGNKIEISPDVSYQKKEIKNIAYKWIINGKIVSEEKNLSEFISLQPGTKYLATFAVIDSDTGVETFTKFTIETESKMKNGWLILSDNKSTAQLSFLRYDNLFYKDIYKDINDETIESHPVRLREHWYSPYQDELGQVLILCKGTPNGSVELDGTTFKKMVYTRQEFPNETPPKDLDPINAHYLGAYSNLLFNSNGKIYIRISDEPGNINKAYQSGIYSDIPLYGDYELSSWHHLIYSYYGMRYILSYDKKNRRYVIIIHDNISNLKMTQKDDLHFPVTNMDKEVISGGEYYGGTTDKYVTVLKSINENKYFVQRFMSGSYSFGKEFSTISENEFPDHSLIKEDSKFVFCEDVNYLYFSSGSMLYRYNHESNIVNLVKDYGKKITAMAIGATIDNLGIGLEGGEFIVVDPSTTGLGEILTTNATDATIVDILWKNGSLPAPW